MYFSYFQDPARTETALTLDLPVVVCDGDWLPVTDLVSGAERGELQVTLAAGTETQLERMSPRNAEEGARPSSVSRLAERREENENDETESEHLYDTVGDEEEEEEEGHKEMPCRESHITATTEEETTASTVRPVLLERQKPQFQATVKVEEARKLPRVFDPARKEKVPPSTFVSFTSVVPSRFGPVKRTTVLSPLAKTTANPKWNFEAASVGVGTELLADPRRHFILKLWHHVGESGDDRPNLETDHVIGFAAVDLSPLLRAGFPAICGWYNIMDFVGRCRGQLKVSITPEEKDLRSAVDVTSLRETLLRRDSEVNNPAATAAGGKGGSDNVNSSSVFRVEAKYNHFPSHVVQHTEQILTAAATPTAPQPVRNDVDGGGGSAMSICESVRGRQSPQWRQPDHASQPEESSTKSFLRNKLTELDDATRRLKVRLSEDAQTGNGDCRRGQVTTRSFLTDAAAAETVVVPLHAMSLEELQGNIESQLLALKRSAGLNPASTPHHQHLIARPAPPPPASISVSSGGPRRTVPEPSTPPPSRSPSPTTVSEEIMEVLASARDDDDRDGSAVGGASAAGAGASVLHSGLVIPGIGSDTLQDLGQIDWDRVLLHDSRGAKDDDDPTSRLGPEGGNPAEEQGQPKSRGRRGITSGRSTDV